MTIFGVFFIACAEIQRPDPEPFYAETTPPARQEFSWSNGKRPQSFDPARAAAAPETDIARALFEGLTGIDPRTLRETPAVAEKWSGSPDFRVWKFQLRKDARWSNGEPLTADDFVTSWKRLATLGNKSAHRELFQNIVGLRSSKAVPLTGNIPIDLSHSPFFSKDEVPSHGAQANSVSTPKTPATVLPPVANIVSGPNSDEGAAKTTRSAPEKFGVEAIDETTLRVTLAMPDRDFPKLVANPIFYPVYGDGSRFETVPLDADIVTNGPFTVASVGGDILLDRSDSYWRRDAVGLERVRFVSRETAEAALAAYRKGEIDAVTNAEFEPLAIKLLSPYNDFRQTVHSALNFYEFNVANPPFSDRRVREALAISIDRERITDGELEHTARPAYSFLPLSDKKNVEISFDVPKAKQLLVDAGFPGGVGFPKIRLLINRNDTQQRVARAVAKMWKQNLDLETEIVVKELSEIEAARALGEYDLVRRGVVLPTVDEIAGIAAIFGTKIPELDRDVPVQESEKSRQDSPKKQTGSQVVSNVDKRVGKQQAETDSAKNANTESDAFIELNAIPLYFPMAYSLVKPYVKGFAVNGLDATALQDIGIDNSWKPATTKSSP